MLDEYEESRSSDEEDEFDEGGQSGLYTTSNTARKRSQTALSFLFERKQALIMVVSFLAALCLLILLLVSFRSSSGLRPSNVIPITSTSSSSSTSSSTTTSSSPSSTSSSTASTSTTTSPMTTTTTEAPLSPSPVTPLRYSLLFVFLHDDDNEADQSLIESVTDNFFQGLQQGSFVPPHQSLNEKRLLSSSSSFSSPSSSSSSSSSSRTEENSKMSSQFPVAVHGIVQISGQVMESTFTITLDGVISNIVRVQVLQNASSSDGQGNSEENWDEIQVVQSQLLPERRQILLFLDWPLQSGRQVFINLEYLSPLSRQPPFQAFSLYSFSSSSSSTASSPSSTTTTTTNTSNVNDDEHDGDVAYLTNTSYIVSQVKGKGIGTNLCPCIDDSLRKDRTEIDVTVFAPPHLQILSTMPIDQSAQLDDFYQVVQFVTTPPIPISSLSLFVGPFHSSSLLSPQQLPQTADQQKNQNHQLVHLHNEENDQADGSDEEDEEDEEDDRVKISIWTINDDTHRQQQLFYQALLNTTQTLIWSFTSLLETPFPLSKLDIVIVPDIEDWEIDPLGLFFLSEKEFSFVLPATIDSHETTWDPSFFSQQNEATMLRLSRAIGRQWFHGLLSSPAPQAHCLLEGLVSFYQYLPLYSTSQQGENAPWISTLIADWKGRLSDTFAAQLSSSAASASASPLSSTPLFRWDHLVDNELPYRKCHTLLRMVSTAISPPTFLQGIAQFVSQYSWSTFTSQDLWSSFDVTAFDLVTLLSDWQSDHPFAFPIQTPQRKTSAQHGPSSVQLEAITTVTASTATNQTIAWWLPQMIHIGSTTLYSNGTVIDIPWPTQQREEEGEEGEAEEGEEGGEGWLQVNGNYSAYSWASYTEEDWSPLLRQLQQQPATSFSPIDRAELLYSLLQFPLIFSPYPAHQVTFVPLTEALNVTRTVLLQESNVEVWKAALLALNRLSQLVGSHADQECRGHFRRYLASLTTAQSNVTILQTLQQKQLRYLQHTQQTPAQEQEERQIESRDENDVDEALLILLFELSGLQGAEWAVDYASNLFQQWSANPFAVVDDLQASVFRITVANRPQEAYPVLVQAYHQTSNPLLRFRYLQSLCFATDIEWVLQTIELSTSTPSSDSSSSAGPHIDEWSNQSPVLALLATTVPHLNDMLLGTLQTFWDDYLTSPSQLPALLFRLADLVSDTSLSQSFLDLLSSSPQIFPLARHIARQQIASNLFWFTSSQFSSTCQFLSQL